MTKFDKANELLNKLDFEDGKYEITDALVDMYDWTKKRFIEWAADWIFKHDSYAKPTELLVKHFKEDAEEL